MLLHVGQLFSSNLALYQHPDHPLAPLLAAIYPTDGSAPTRTRVSFRTMPMTESGKQLLFDQFDPLRNSSAAINSRRMALRRTYGGLARCHSEHALYPEHRHGDVAFCGSRSGNFTNCTRCDVDSYEYREAYPGAWWRHHQGWEHLLLVSMTMFIGVSS